MNIICVVDGCENPKRRKNGMCDKHYRKSLGGPCLIDGCLGPTIAKGLCSKHYQRVKNGISMDYERPSGKTYISSDGYVVEYIRGHIQADKDGKLLQHRRIMSDKLGRRLEPYENVHHKNGNRADNRLENLELWVKRQPAGQRVEDLIEYAEWIMREYGEQRS